jgi:hypothetical protein
MTIVNRYKHDNNVSQKLQELNELPQELSFNATAVWQKLELQLQPKKRFKKTAWISIAALLLLIAGTYVYTMLSNKKEAPAVAVKQETDIESKKTELIKKQFVTSSSDKVRHQAVTTDNKVNEAVTVKSIEPNDTIKVEQPVFVVPEIAAIVQPSTSNPVVVSQPATAQVKKPKLKIIHLNELYNASPEEITKVDMAKKQAATEPDPEPVITNTPRLFWRTKIAPKITISITDNQ